MTPELGRLLDAGRAFDAEYAARGADRGWHANHRPTALWALHRLGASDTRLAQWATRYEARLQAAPPPEPWPAGEAWPPRLGDPRAWPAYRSLFAEWLDNEGVGELLTPVLPQLMQGCAAAGFHGMVRVACAVPSGHQGELADALAYWACRWWPVPAARGAPADDGRPLPAPGAHAERAAEAFARSGHPVALQLVTAARAMQVLLPHLADDARAERASMAAWQRAFDCAWTALPRSRGLATRALPWDEVVARAIASDDALTIEAVAACRDWQAACGGAVWQQAATRAVG